MRDLALADGGFLVVAVPLAILALVELVGYWGLWWLILPAVSPSRISALRGAEYLEIATAGSMKPWSFFLVVGVEGIRAMLQVITGDYLGLAVSLLIVGYLYLNRDLYQRDRDGSGETASD